MCSTMKDIRGAPFVARRKRPLSRLHTKVREIRTVRVLVYRGVVNWPYGIFMSEICLQLNLDINYTTIPSQVGGNFGILGPFCPVYWFSTTPPLPPIWSTEAEPHVNDLPIYHKRWSPR